MIACPARLLSSVWLNYYFRGRAQRRGRSQPCSPQSRACYDWKKSSGETWKRRQSFSMWDFEKSLLAFKTSDATLGLPNTSRRSACLKLLAAMSSRTISMGAAGFSSCFSSKSSTSSVSYSARRSSSGVSQPRSCRASISSIWRPFCSSVRITYIRPRSKEASSASSTSTHF